MALRTWLARIDADGGIDIYDLEFVRAETRGKATAIAADRYCQDFTDVRLKRVKAWDGLESATPRQWLEQGFTCMQCPSCDGFIAPADEIEGEHYIWIGDELYHPGCVRVAT